MVGALRSPTQDGWLGGSRADVHVHLFVCLFVCVVSPVVSYRFPPVVQVGEVAGPDVGVPVLLQPRHGCESVGAAGGMGGARRPCGAHLCTSAAVRSARKLVADCFVIV